MRQLNHSHNSHKMPLDLKYAYRFFNPTILKPDYYQKEYGTSSEVSHMENTFASDLVKDIFTLYRLNPYKNFLYEAPTKLVHITEDQFEDFICSLFAFDDILAENAIFLIRHTGEKEIYFVDHDKIMSYFSELSIEEILTKPDIEISVSCISFNEEPDNDVFAAFDADMCYEGYGIVVELKPDIYKIVC